MFFLSNRRPHAISHCTGVSDFSSPNLKKIAEKPNTPAPHQPRNPIIQYRSTTTVAGGGRRGGGEGGGEGGGRGWKAHLETEFEHHHPGGRGEDRSREMSEVERAEGDQGVVKSDGAGGGKKRIMRGKGRKNGWDKVVEKENGEGESVDIK